MSVPDIRACRFRLKKCLARPDYSTLQQKAT